MSKADKMFKEIGYIDVSEDWGFCVYEGKDGFVQFFEEEKKVGLPLTDYDVSRNDYMLFVVINEKMKELGWISEL